MSFLREIKRHKALLPVIGFGSALFLLGMAVAASYLDTQRMIETTSQVDETHNVLARLSNFSVGIERVVTIARVFVLTGEEDFVAPLEQTQRDINDDLATLRQMFMDDPGQLEKLASLKELTVRRLAMTDEYIDLRRRMGLQQTTEQIPFGGEKLATDIRALIADVEQTLRFQLEQRRAAAAASHASTLTTIIFTGLASVGILFLAFTAFRRQDRARAELEREIITTGENERARIGHDLHDSLGQELTGISLGLEGLAKTLEREQSTHAQTVQRLKALTQESISETRRISRSLSPGFRRELGICEALRTLASEVNRNSNVNCEAHCSAQDDVDDPEVAAQLIRIAQEGINNALRHGNAQNIELCYGREGDSAYLEVIDDGIGIPAERDRVEGLGLKSMRYRTRLINGTLDVAAKARGGTEVRCSFKYSAPEGEPLRAEL
ncbi:MAG: CHASE3 domain-containing protein [Gammaproteobacteria bacterium]